MTTTELIKILQDNEKGGISHKPRQISLTINGRYMPEPKISLSSTGDGICGPEIDLDVDGEWFAEPIEPTIIRCNDCRYYRALGERSYCTKRLNVDSVTDRYRAPDFYCADAELREVIND